MSCVIYVYKLILVLNAACITVNNVLFFLAHDMRVFSSADGS